jgi:hypothetical protein
MTSTNIINFLNRLNLPYYTVSWMEVTLYHRTVKPLHFGPTQKGPDPFAHYGPVLGTVFSTGNEEASLSGNSEEEEDYHDNQERYPMEQSPESFVLSQSDEFFHVLNESEVQSEKKSKDDFMDYIFDQLLDKFFNTKIGTLFLILCQFYVYFRKKYQVRTRLAQWLREHLRDTWESARIERNKVAETRTRGLEMPENKQFCDKFNCPEQVEILLPVQYHRKNRSHKVSTKKKNLPPRFHLKNRMYPFNFCEFHEPLSIFNLRHASKELDRNARMVQLLITNQNRTLPIKGHFEAFEIVCLRDNEFNKRWFRGIQEQSLDCHLVVYLWRCLEEQDREFCKDHQSEFEEYCKTYIDS